MDLVFFVFRLRRDQESLLQNANPEVLADAQILFPSSLHRQIDFIQRHGGLQGYDAYARKVKLCRVFLWGLGILVLVVVGG